jgi:hypothetical protein
MRKLLEDLMDQKQTDEKRHPEEDQKREDKTKDTQVSPKVPDFSIKPIKMKVRKYNLKFPEDGMF